MQNTIMETIQEGKAGGFKIAEDRNATHLRGRVTRENKRLRKLEIHCSEASTGRKHRMIIMKVMLFISKVIK